MGERLLSWVWDQIFWLSGSGFGAHLQDRFLRPAHHTRDKLGCLSRPLCLTHSSPCAPFSSLSLSIKHGLSLSRVYSLFDQKKSSVFATKPHTPQPVGQSPQESIAALSPSRARQDSQPPAGTRLLRSLCLALSLSVFLSFSVSPSLSPCLCLSHKNIPLCLPLHLPLSIYIVSVSLTEPNKQSPPQHTHLQNGLLRSPRHKRDEFGSRLPERGSLAVPHREPLLWILVRGR